MDGCETAAAVACKYEVEIDKKRLMKLLFFRYFLCLGLSCQTPLAACGRSPLFFMKEEWATL